MAVRDAPRLANTRLHRQRGSIYIVTAIGLLGLLAFGALSVDAGLLWATRTQLQNAADAAALAGAFDLIDPDVPVVTTDLALASTLATGADNQSFGTASVDIQPSDVDFGNWDLDTRTFDPNVDLTNPDLVTAVRVRTRKDASANRPVPAILSRVLGRTDYAVTADATAYLGWAGAVAPGKVDLPVTIPCCELRGAQCDQDYCSYITQNPPNPCELANPQDAGANTVSCLEFYDTGAQNACYTSFDSDSSSVNTADLIDILYDGPPESISTENGFFVDNGTKAPVVREIGEKFRGEGSFSGDPHGTDRYPPFDGVADSWVVGLPVIECQDSDHCAKGVPAGVEGFVCIEIREVEDSPLKLIRARFLCETDPLMAECDVGASRSGGLDFGLRADIPVLVQ